MRCITFPSSFHGRKSRKPPILHSDGDAKESNFGRSGNASELVVSPASLLDSQHGCIASPHAKKESGQTPLAVWSCTVSKCGRTVSKDE